MRLAILESAFSCGTKFLHPLR